MAWVVNDGVLLHYAVVGTGPPLVMHVGFLSSLEDWQLPGLSYVDYLKQNRTLILLDPRGQGRSDKPYDPDAYSMDHRTADVIAVLDNLGIKRAPFWGYSLGGRVAFELAMRFPERLSGMISGGANLYRRVDPDTDSLLANLRAGMVTVVREWEREFGQLPVAMRERWLENDARALAAAWTAPGQPFGAVDHLHELSVPSLLYVGGNDHMYEMIVRPSEVIPNSELVVFDQLNHMETFYRPDLVIPHVVRFLDSH